MYAEFNYGYESVKKENFAGAVLVFPQTKYLKSDLGLT